MTYFYNFGTPFISLESTKVRNFKFGVLIDRQVYKPKKNSKVGQKGRGLRHVTYFLNFGNLLHISGMGTARDFKFGAD